MSLICKRQGGPARCIFILNFRGGGGGGDDDEAREAHAVVSSHSSHLDLPAAPRRAAAGAMQSMAPRHEATRPATRYLHIEYRQFH